MSLLVHPFDAVPLAKRVRERVRVHEQVQVREDVRRLIERYIREAFLRCNR